MSMEIVFIFCRKLTLSKDEADDLYQQTFLRAVEIRKKISKDKNPKSFLIAIAISIWKNSIRKKARRNRIAPIISIDDNPALEISDQSSDIENEIINCELKKQVNLIVSNLRDKLRIPIIMYYNTEMSVGNIAITLKIPKGTVKSRLHKARLLIKNELEAKGYYGWE
jgi:RNA polymerase sigma-70 factor, ECF subfamily